MMALDWMIIGAGIAAIAWVNWYFLFAERGAHREGVSSHD